MAGEAGTVLGKVAKIVFGVILILLGIWSYTYWWRELLILFKGGVGLIVILIGLVFILIGWSD